MIGETLDQVAMPIHQQDLQDLKDTLVILALLDLLAHQAMTVRMEEMAEMELLVGLDIKEKQDLLEQRDQKASKGMMERMVKTE